MINTCYNNLCGQILCHLFYFFHITPSSLREIMKKCALSMVATRKCNVGVATLAWLLHFFFVFPIFCQSFLRRSFFSSYLLESFE